jgi:hypothetical protein
MKRDDFDSESDGKSGPVPPAISHPALESAEKRSLCRKK